MIFLEKISAVIRRVIKGLILLFRGDFSTMNKRIRALLFKNDSPVFILEDIKPKIRLAGKLKLPTNAASNSSKKVLVIDRNFKRFGSSISLSEIILPLHSQLKDVGIELQLACREIEGKLSNAYGKQFTLHGLKQFPRNMSLASKYESEVENLASELSVFEPDVIYVNSVDMFPVIDAARISGIPTIWNIREAQNWRLRLSDRHPDIIARALACFSYPDSFVFVSEVSAQNWREFTATSQTHVIKTAIKPEAFENVSISQAKEIRLRLGIPRDGIMLLTVGTLCMDKGQIDAANAISRLPVDIRDKIHWVFIGNSDLSYVKKIKQEWPTRHAIKNLHLDGHIENCAPYYFAANALVSCSKTEAMPRNILEGKLAGLPIISSNIPGSREALKFYKNVFYYELGDIDELSAHIRKIPAKNYSLMTKHGITQASGEYQKMINEYFNVINTLCHG